MATFYRGAGVDTYWHQNDARLVGFIPQDSGANFSLDKLMRHISRGTTFSPFVSLTLSYGVACDYALYAGRNPPGQSKPAYVYEIEFSPAPPGIAVVNPIWEVVHSQRDPVSGSSYYHDGQQSFLLGVVSPTAMRSHLAKNVLHPPPNQGTPRPPNLSIELETVTRALRDSEVLVYGTVPRSCITNRYDVY